jgi:hypothetical protein
MKKPVALILAGGVELAQAALGDASYQESTQITGGQLIDALKSLPFAKQKIQKILDPIVSSNMLHGNQFASVSTSSTQIIDLDQETITHIDPERKTYTVITFAQMRQAMQDGAKKLGEAQNKAQATPPAATDAQASQIQVTYEVSVTDTGVSRAVNGIMAKEQILTMKAHVTNTSPSHDAGPNMITYSYIADIWSAPEPAEMREIAAFYVRYAKKILQGVDAATLLESLKPVVTGSALASIFASNPGMGPAAQEMMKKMAIEMQKIKGTTIVDIARFGRDAMIAPSGTVAATPPPPPSMAGNPLVTQVATNTASDVAASQVAKLGSIGGAFGRSLLGALHKPASSTNDAAIGTPGGASPSTAVLFESTTQKSNFSSDAISVTAFQIPAGFAKVDAAFPGGEPK